MYNEYKTPKVKFNITIADLGWLFVWALLAAGLIGIIFGIVVGVLSTNTETIDNRLENDCLVITYHENHAFSPDEDLSGIYCREQQ